MRRRPIILSKNEKLIAAAVGTASLIHFVEAQQRIVEKIAHRGLVRAAQQVLA